MNYLFLLLIILLFVLALMYVVSGLRYAIACSVQRGNAMIASAGYANALRVFRDSA